MSDAEEAKATGSSPSAAYPMAVDSLDDEVSSPFQCCVCLDILYKPVVLACGHISCFWCVHKAMHGLRASHCAICRQPYVHFPSICQLLHFLLLKLEPVAYKRREMEILVEEKAADVYSPQFADQLELEKLHFDAFKGNGSSSKKFNDCRSGDFERSDLSENCLDHTIKRNISVDDVSCSLCKEMLYQPAVLNCGHVYCVSCLSDLSGEHLRCQVCQSFHPGEFPNICLDLDHFLEERFPREYAVRREQVQHKKAQCQHVNPSPNAVRKQKPMAQVPSGGMDLWLKEDVSDVHVGVGCDSCGIYPIIGKRYKCKDCKEAIGFDLCEACYNSTSKLPGRFNQQHTPDHAFELDESQMLRNILMQRDNQFDIPQQGLEVIYVPSDDDLHDHENHGDEGSGGEEELR
ncbi:E3 ubiquitin-protein ligase PRT1-like isoform X1 [Musa acuminata AAA Group]|uniref:E3 ubiquitin-protein ligase PRT1-like isoform X1 n=1 Tax=Musa acuminata AAA Group TaxID=214697 RepID=UPI0031DA0FF5